jgi:putative addiction module component (TIGR02574 family)
MLVRLMGTRYRIAMTAVDEIKKQALALGVKERASLAESLLGSLPPVAEEWSEAEELAEAERREREIESGQVQALHEGEFWERVEARRRK